MHMKSNVLLLVALLVGVSHLCAGESPSLMVDLGSGAQPLTVETVKAEVLVHGFLAETRMTLTFRNPHNRQLAGDLIFPLPEGSTVAGYALDIGETMVPGVVVTKEKARVVFEKEMRKGVDPGIVEWTKGNTFKTRVFPIPANGTRTIRVRYVSEIDTALGSPRYVLPLRFKDKLKEFSLDVRVLKASAKARGAYAEKGGFRSEGAGLSEYRYQSKDEVVDSDFEVLLNYVEDDLVLVETDAEGRTWFCLMDSIDLDDEAGNIIQPRRITVLWDASASRARSDHARELALLRQYIQKALPRPAVPAPDVDAQPAPIAVDVVLFRNAAEAPKTFVCSADGNGPEDVIKFLESVRYDGGTTLSAIQPTRGMLTPDLYLLFTDGLHTFGNDPGVQFPAPVYAFSEDSSTDAARLAVLCGKSGGQYVNLTSISAENALALIGRPVNAVKQIGAKDGDLTALCPAPGEPVAKRLIVCGRLGSATADLAVKLSLDDGETPTYRIRADQAVEGDLLRTYWAQRRLQQLLLKKDENAELITAHGKEHGIVTPGTSLIVLDNLEQYVEHEILPPRELPQMRAKYAEIMEQRGAQQKQQTESKIQQVLAMWNSRVGWWNQEFKVSKDFKYQAEKAEKGEGADTGAAPLAEDVDAATVVAGSRTGSGRGQAVTRHGGAPEGGEASRGDAEAPGPTPVPTEQAADRINAVDERLDGLPATTDGLVRNRLSEPPTSPMDRNEEGQAAPGVAMSGWKPDAEYMKALAKTGKDRNEALGVYLEQRAAHGKAPSFYLEAADHFLAIDDRDAALRVLSNIAELELENAALLRILAHRLDQIGELDLAAVTFEEVKRMRPEEPQSWRDLALVYDRLGRHDEAVKLLYHVVMHTWDRFQQIEAIALMEINRIGAKNNLDLAALGVDERLVKHLDVDLRIVMSWDADLTDIDLWVTEPTGETCIYNHNRTAIGGALSRDFTQGYGPEEYLLKKGHPGVYEIRAHYYGSRSVTLAGSVTVQATVYTNYGRPNEKRQAMTLRLKQTKDKFLVGKVEF